MAVAVGEERRRCLYWEHDSTAVGLGDVLTSPSLSFGQWSTINGLVELELQGDSKPGVWWNSFPETGPLRFPLHGVD